ncbi:MAG TPA: barstar family protein [Candidatus Acidoferrum sp.]|nr:barstar family protein [Candidatus Acidoferrum sp.]
MNNTMYKITENELSSIYQGFNKQGDVWIAEIDGSHIATWKDYAREIERVFRFPSSCDKSMDAYLDWMTDLSWLNAQGYVLIIKNIKEFMRNDPKKKEKILRFFIEDILPFWQSGVEQYVVAGKAKPFDVYLVD